MTLLQDRPEAVEAPAEPTARPLRGETWLDTSDHKRIGLLFIYAAFVFVVGGGVLGLLVGAKKAAPSLGIASDRWARLYGLHTGITVLLFLTALWVGLSTYVVPLQVGAGRLALPRLHALGLWSYLVGGVLLVTSYIMGAVAGSGIVSPDPLSAAGGATNHATSLWIASLALVTLGFVLASVSLVSTVAALRTDGLTMLRLPAFSWATFVAGAVFLVAGPVFLAGLLLLYLDQHFGGRLFASPGGVAVWQHLVWLWGRPDVYLLTLVGLGAATDMVTTHTRRPLISHTAVLGALGLFGALSLAVWASDTGATDAVIVPTTTVAASLVVIPLVAVVGLWLLSLAPPIGPLALLRPPGAEQSHGAPRFHVSLLFVAGAIVLWLVGAANAVAAAVKDIPGVHGHSAWVVGNIHTVVVGPPTLLAVGALYHWGPKAWGRRLSAPLGGLSLLSLLGGFLALGMSGYLLGYNGARAGLNAHPTSYQKGLSWLGEAGGVLLLLGLLVVVVDVAASVAGRRGALAGDDPYEGGTLEWATASPPPPYGFEAVPEVRSATPLVALRAQAGGPGLAETGAGTGGRT